MAASLGFGLRARIRVEEAASRALGGSASSLGRGKGYRWKAAQTSVSARSSAGPAVDVAQRRAWGGGVRQDASLFERWELDQQVIACHLVSARACIPTAD